MSMKLRLAGLGGAAPQTYVDDVFSTYLYTGNGSTQTINNGIDLAGKGGLVWLKSRSSPNWRNCIFDTSRGVLNRLATNTTDAQEYISSSLEQFNSNGFSLNGAYNENEPNKTYASWTFRKAAKFFDVVTYTGTGSARTIAHNLGVAPGMVIVKRTDTTGNWQVYSNGLTSAAYSIQLNLYAAQASAPTVWNSTAPTSSVFSVGTDATVNASGGTYVAYLFAHDPSADGIIQCGSFTGSATVNLGWEPQYLMIKNTTTAQDWRVYDSMRGLDATGNVALLRPNLSNSEAATSGASISATGFTYPGGTDTYIYMAIRRPNKPPTSGTQVFSPIAYTLNNTANRYLSGFGFPTDLSIFGARSIAAEHATYDRLRGGSAELQTQSTAAEYSTYPISLDKQDGILLNSSNWNGVLGATAVWWNFKRAPGFFDVVCYTGAYSASADQVVNHNLTVSPELLILKKRSVAGSWGVISTTLGLNRYLLLEATNASSNWQFISAVSSSTFSINKIADNYSENNSTYVAYLFATLAGISKVGSYTGNGSSQNIECGFAAGARFVLIKRTDSTGDWFVWDTARGIVAANDPHLSLNTTAAEVTTDDSIDPYSAGFTVNQVAATNINVSSATYIYLAIA